MKKTYTVKEVSDLLGFSTNTVYKYLDEGKIKATRLGKEGRFRIQAQEVERLLPESKQPTTSYRNTDEPTDQPNKSNQEIIGNEKRESSGTFSLFDWFISLNSI